MADEENLPPEPPRDGDLDTGGTPQSTQGSTPGSTGGRRRGNAPRGRPQPINLEVARDPNILANPGWQNERGTWMYSTVRRYVEWTHLTRMFVPSANAERMSKQRYGIWREVSHQIFGERCKEVWDFLWGAPREFDRGHMLMWLCQMVYAEVILGVDIDWSTIPRTSADLRAARRLAVIPSAVLGRNAGRPIPLAWQTPMNPPTVRSYFDFLAGPNHQIVGTPPPADSNILPGLPVEPPSRRQRVHMTPHHEPWLVCPPSSPVDTEMVPAEPTPPLVVADNDVVEALRAELAKCKLDHERGLEMVRREHGREVEGLKAEIAMLTNLELSRIEAPDMPQEGGANDGQGQEPSTTTDLEAMRVDYDRVVRRNRMLEDGYMGMVTATIMYATRERALMDELTHYRDNGEQWPDRRLLFTSWPPLDFMYPESLPVDEANYPSIAWTKRPEDEFQWDTAVSSRIVVPPAKPALLWPCVPDWIKDGSTCAICSNPWGPEGAWIIGSCGHMVHPNCLLPHMMQTRRCPSCKAPLHRRLYEQFGVQWGMPPDFEYTAVHGVPKAEYGDPPAYSWRARMYVKDLRGYPTKFTKEMYTRVAHEFYPGSSPQAVGLRAFLYRVVGGHAGENGEYVEGPHPQGYIYDSNGNVTVGVLPREPVPGEETTWDVEHVLDTTSYENDPARQEAITKEASFNEMEVQTRMNEWKYVNGLMDLRDGASSPTMQDIIRHSSPARGLQIGDRARTRAQAARENEAQELWALQESLRDARRQTLLARNRDGASSSRGPPIALDSDSEPD